jgi:type IV secretory pathway VirB2 component (pilin)
MYDRLNQSRFSDSFSIVKLFFFFCAVITILSIDQTALAAGASNDVFNEKFCNILKILKGPAMKIIASVAIVATGIAAVSGKMQWPTVLVTAAGVIVIFSADSLVGLLTGEDMSNVCK